MKRILGYIGPGKVRAGLLLACLAAYGVTLGTTGFIHDDQWAIGENPLLERGLGSLPDIFTTGYWQVVRGEGTSIQQYRPILTASFLFHRMTTGKSEAPMHAVNLILHAAVCLLLFEFLRSRVDPITAGMASLFYAVMPVHSEAVASLGGRSEVLSAAFMLAAWNCLGRRPAALLRGAALFAAALLTKEHSILFVLFLPLADRSLDKRRISSQERLKVYGTLLAIAAAYLFLRSLVLPRSLQLGGNYFVGTAGLAATLTVARFLMTGYLRPSLSGLGLCTDFSRPLIADATLSSPLGWLSLAGLLALFSCAVVAALRRRAWGFWVVGPALFLLPTLHILLPIDTLGAQRFLYLPSVGLAVLLGLGWAGLRSRNRFAADLLGGVFIVSQLVMTAAHSLNWTSSERYYQAAVECNPVSARARAALGTAKLSQGRRDEGLGDLRRSIAMDPQQPLPYYNLGKLALEDNDAASAEKHLRRTLSLDPGAPNAWVLLGISLEAQSRLEEASKCFGRALELRPLDIRAHFNLGRNLILRGSAGKARAHLERFLEMAPNDPDAEWARGMIKELSAADR